jgi:hypothetical protein
VLQTFIGLSDYHEKILTAAAPEAARVFPVEGGMLRLARVLRGMGKNVKIGVLPAFDPYTPDSAFYLKVDPVFSSIEVRGDVFIIDTGIVTVYLNRSYSGLCADSG